MCITCCESKNRKRRGQHQSVPPLWSGAPETQAAMDRIEADISRRTFLGGTAAVIGMFAGFGLAPRELRAQTPGRPTLLTNLPFFDGSTLAMQTGRDILIDGGRIVALPAAGTGPEDADVIDCGGRAVTPGLIDCHWHATLVKRQPGRCVDARGTSPFVHLVAGQEAGATLMRGSPRCATPAVRSSA